MADAVTRTKILFAANAFWGSTWYRSHVPGVALQELGYEAVLTESPRPDHVEWCDVYATRLWVDGPMWEAMRYAKSLGKLCVLDVDDDVWAVHPNNPGYEHYSNPAAQDHARAVVRAADVVTVATEYLADLLRPLNPNVRVVRNVLPGEMWPAQAKSLLHEPPIVVGWAGSSSHAPDMSILSGVVETVLDACPRAIFAFSNTVPLPFTESERVQLWDFMSIEQYPSMLGRFDVGLAPILDNRFNRAKSDLKVIEYGMCGVPTIASKVVPYEGTIRHGENGFLCGSAKDWIKCIRRLVDDDALRESMGAAARATAERRTIEHHVGKWVKALGLTPLVAEEADSA